MTGVGNIFLESKEGKILIGTIDLETHREMDDSFIWGQVILNLYQDKRVDSFETQISTLESWRQSIDTWKSTVITTLSTIATSISSLVTKTNSQETKNTNQDTTLNTYETRIVNLENNNQTPFIVNGSLPNYFKYLNSGDRKTIVCGYAQDNHLINVTDLGWNCIVTYRQTSRGETSSCRCKAI